MPAKQTLVQVRLSMKPIILPAPLFGTFQETLASEARDISTEAIPYNDLCSTARYPTIEPQRILLGFSLPPYHFSYTASTKYVVDVFCQLVSFVHDHQAWDDYVFSTNYHALVPVRGSWLIFPTVLIWAQRDSVIWKGH